MHGFYKDEALSAKYGFAVYTRNIEEDGQMFRLSLRKPSWRVFSMATASAGDNEMLASEITYTNCVIEAESAPEFLNPDSFLMTLGVMAFGPFITEALGKSRPGASTLSTGKSEGSVSETGTPSQTLAA